MRTKRQIGRGLRYLTRQTDRQTDIEALEASTNVHTHTCIYTYAYIRTKLFIDRSIERYADNRTNERGVVEAAIRTLDVLRRADGDGYA